ncbi:hypothetical protein ACLB2K_074702 [Fragaria x ananassa]
MPLNILHPFQLAVQSTTTISELKEMVRIQVGISPARQSLFFSGDELSGDATLRDLGVPIDSTLILTVGDPIPASSSGGHGNAVFDYEWVTVHHFAIPGKSYGRLNAGGSGYRTVHLADQPGMI